MTMEFSSPPRTPATQRSVLTPLPHDTKTPGSASSINTARIQQSPLKVAASLIQSLDIAHTEMNSFAVDAATDAERARENARKAQEIARRYQNRIYPSFQLESFVSNSKDSSGRGASTQTSPFVGSSRPKRPEIRRFHTTLTPRTKFTITGSQAKTVEEKDDPSKKDHGDEGNTNNKDVNNLVPPTSPTPYPRGKTLLAPQSPSPNTYQRSKHRMAPQSPTSFERLAQHHADDLLQLSMELEQTKQALKSEQRSHKECQSALETMKAKKMKSDRANQKLVHKCAKEREESTTQISNLERELELSLLRRQAAEEDAELALDLARVSAEEKGEMEASLMEARREIEILRAHQDGKAPPPPPPAMTTPKRSVHFADTDTNSVTDNSTTITPVPLIEKETPLFHSPREHGPSRAMIAAGRQILLRRNMTPQDAVLRLEVSPAKSAERRQQLCQRLNEHLNESTNEDSSIALLSSSPSRTPLSPTPGRNTTAVGDSSGTNQKLEEYNNAMKIMQSSGKRLELDGYWWREQNSKTMSSNSNPVQIDVIARQYCQNVEFKINRQQKDIQQLESLCGYLEKKLVFDGE